MPNSILATRVEEELRKMLADDFDIKKAGAVRSEVTRLGKLLANSPGLVLPGEIELTVCHILAMDQALNNFTTQVASKQQRNLGLLLHGLRKV